MAERIYLYDTTLRDGCQGVGVSFSLADKILVTRALDDFGVDYIEGGWPGSNPKDTEYFERVKGLKLKHARISAFGATRRRGLKAEQDENLMALVRTGTPVVTVFGKCWPDHIHAAMRIEAQENLEMIFDSVSWLSKRVEELIFDAEHFFDGFAENVDYALLCLKTALEAGAKTLVLCDTNGGRTPDFIEASVRKVRETCRGTSLGIHAHNDSELAVANSLAAVQSGVAMVQGTINGMGERCGNANLCSLIPALRLKLKDKKINPDIALPKLYGLSRYVAEAANGKVIDFQPYVGDCAFAHKGGVHVSAVKRNPKTYEHIEPEAVGNQRRVTVSELSGKSNILALAESLGYGTERMRPHAAELLGRVKALEAMGYHYEGAEASLELLIRREMGDMKTFFHIHGYRVWVWKEGGESVRAEATIKAELAEEYAAIDPLRETVAHISADGKGPVEALDKALRMALEGFFPCLKQVRLLDYTVRILNESAASRAQTRVLIRSGDSRSIWSTVGVSENIIEASWMALMDGAQYFLLKRQAMEDQTCL